MLLDLYSYFLINISCKNDAKILILFSFRVMILFYFISFRFFYLPDLKKEHYLIDISFCKREYDLMIETERNGMSEKKEL